MDNSSILSILGPVFFVIQLLSFVTFILQAYWIYQINKKFWEEYPWLAFIPVINIYSFVKAAWKDWIWVLWLILWFIAFGIPWLIITIVLIDNISRRTGHGFWMSVWILFFPYICLPIIGSQLPEWWI